jgi:hypothetical protein
MNSTTGPVSGELIGVSMRWCSVTGALGTHDRTAKMGAPEVDGKKMPAARAVPGRFAG